jgi:cell pole-organizing protein PopZ
MNQPAKSHEPSMEEILASIRRIIADDDVKPEEAAAPAAAAPAPTSQPREQPKEQAKVPPPAAVAPKPAPAPAAKPAAAAPAPVAKAPEPKPAPPPAAAAPAPASNNQDDIDALLAGLDADTSDEEVRSAPEPVAAADDEEDVLELTEQMEVVEEEPESFKTIQPADDIEFSEADEPKAAEPPRRPERAQERTHVPVPPPPVRAYEESEPVQPQAPLVSAQTATAVNSAFNALAQTVLSNNARTLEDLVKEMLRPMLQGWLDDNLPGLVEKIVRAEIERVSRGR